MRKQQDQGKVLYKSKMLSVEEHPQDPSMVMLRMSGKLYRRMKAKADKLGVSVTEVLVMLSRGELPT